MARGVKGVLSNHETAKPLPVPDFSEVGGNDSYSSGRIPGGGFGARAPTSMLTRQPADQKPPTEDFPVREHHKMAGMDK